MKNILLFVFILLYCTVHSQETLFQIQLPTDFKVKRTFQVTNRDTHEMVLFFSNNKEIFTTLINDEIKEIKSFKASDFSKDFNIPVAVQKKSKDIFNLYLSDKSMDEFNVVEFDFNSKSTKTEKIDLELKKETLLHTFHHNGKLHFISIENRSSILNFYVFLNDGSFSKKTLDLSNEKFRYWDNSFVDIYTLMSRPYGVKTNEILVKIDASTPNSLEVSASPSKLFIEKDALYFTFESNRNITQVVEIDTGNLEYTITTFNKPFIPNAPAWKKTNSFLFRGKYLGVAATNDLFKFEIKDYKTREIINSFSVEKNNGIAFKNTPIGIEGSLYRNKPREMENENRFLRDLANAEIGVSIYPQNENYIVTLGSFEVVNTPIMGIGIPIAQIGFINLTAPAYFSITNSHSTYFKSIFNQNFEHQKGEVPKSSFEKITDYSTGLNNSQVKDVFKSKETPVFGHLDGENNYKVIKF